MATVHMPKPPKQPSQQFQPLPGEGAPPTPGSAESAASGGGGNYQQLPGQVPQGLDPIDQTWMDLSGLYGESFTTAANEHLHKLAFKPDEIPLAVKSRVLPYEEAKKRLDLYQDSPVENLKVGETGAGLPMRLATGVLGSVITPVTGVERLLGVGPKDGIFSDEAYRTYEEMRSEHNELWLGQLASEAALGWATTGVATGLLHLAKWKAVLPLFAFGYATTPVEGKFSVWRFVGGAAFGLGGFYQKAAVKPKSAVETVIEEGDKLVPVATAGGKEAAVKVNSIPQVLSDSSDAAQMAVQENRENIQEIVNSLIELGKDTDVLANAAKARDMITTIKAANSALEAAGKFRFEMLKNAGESKALLPFENEAIAAAQKQASEVIGRLASLVKDDNASKYVTEILANEQTLIHSLKEGKFVKLALDEYQKAINLGANYKNWKSVFHFDEYQLSPKSLINMKTADEIADSAINVERPYVVRFVKQIIASLESDALAKKTPIPPETLDAVKQAIAGDADVSIVLNYIANLDTLKTVAPVVEHDALAAFGASRAEVGMAKLLDLAETAETPETARLLGEEYVHGMLTLWRWRATGSNAAGYGLSEFIHFADSLPNAAEPIKDILLARQAIRESGGALEKLWKLVPKREMVNPPNHGQLVSEWLESLADWVEHAKQVGLSDAAIADEVSRQVNKLDKLEFVKNAKEISQLVRGHLQAILAKQKGGK